MGMTGQRKDALGRSKAEQRCQCQCRSRLLQIGLLHDVLLIAGWLSHGHPTSADNGCAAAWPGL